jgi:hypothetical protein
MAERHRWVICATAYLLCTGLALGAEGTFDGDYVGRRVLTKGPMPPCVAEENVSVTIHGDTLSFTDSALRNVVIGFEPHEDGSFNRIYADVGGDTVLIEGRIVGGVLEADVINGACEHHWRLKKG